MGRNGLYLIIGILVVAVAVLGFMLYDEKRNEPGIDVQIGEDGFSVETN